jgi:hypothetical protein
MPETTDPTCCRSPAAAIDAPPEQLAHVGDASSDSYCFVD